MNFNSDQSKSRGRGYLVILCIVLFVSVWSLYTSVTTGRTVAEVSASVKSVQEILNHRQQSARAKTVEDAKAAQAAEAALPNEVLTADAVKALAAAMEKTEWEACGVPPEMASKRRAHIKSKLENGFPIKQADERFLQRSMQECEDNKEKFKAEQAAREQDKAKATEQLASVFGQTVSAPAAPKAERK